VIFADQLKDLGYSTPRGPGISIGIKDMVIPPSKERAPRRARTRGARDRGPVQQGLITDGERYNKVVDIWAEVTDRIADEMMEKLGVQTRSTTGGQAAGPELQSDLHDGRLRRPRQRAADPPARGMRGLMAKPSGEIIETPITANFREGLTVLQYFISTHGARKGLADTALKTANSGYLTRRLVDVAQDSIITERDCGTIDGIEMTPLVEGGEVIEPLGDRVLGRVALEDVIDPFTGDVIVRANEEIDEEKVARSRKRARAREDPLGAHLPVEDSGVCANVLRPRPGARPHGQPGRGRSA
jgi:DNA-directed RNA polymerase subunit beta'